MNKIGFIKSLLLIFLIFSSCSGKILIFPEPPFSPGIRFNAENDRLYITKEDGNKLLIYMEELKVYREKLLKFVESLK